MIHIRPVSDLRNKFPEIEEIVLNKNVPVFLTKNGHGSMVVLSVEQYTTLMESVESVRSNQRKNQWKIVSINYLPITLIPFSN